MFLCWRHICEGDPLAVRRPTDNREVNREVIIGNSGGAQFSFRPAKRRDNVDSGVGAVHAMKGDLRAIGGPCRTDPFRGMLRKAEKSFASEGLHVQVEAV